LKLDYIRYKKISNTNNAIKKSNMSEIEKYLNEALKKYDQEDHKAITSEFVEYNLLLHNILDVEFMAHTFLITVQTLGIKSISQKKWEKTDPIEEIQFYVNIVLEKYYKEDHKEITNTFYKKILSLSEIELNFEEKISAINMATFGFKTISSKSDKTNQNRVSPRESWPRDPESEWDSMVRNGGDFDKWH